MAKHYADKDDQVGKDANFGLTDVEIPIIGEGVRANVPKVGVLVVDRSDAVDVDQRVMKQRFKCIRVVDAGRFYATTFERPDLVDIGCCHFAYEHAFISLLAASGSARFGSSRRNRSAFIGPSIKLPPGISRH